ncbi:hypothetical protein NQ318_013844 [Aromia moschata]|uniref:Uncharacterized protein n=1 Tax=Aromia moschata TaxID=1265417 RepID=A0AAV8Z8P0_9CUCU|nr:hypothetical protein NQ318_013844 [Aromia moschata]
MPEVVDITVEEPTSTFQKIRDYDDCLTVHRELDTHNINICTDDVKTIFEHMRKYKLCKRQCQRVYDILGSYKAAKTSQIAYLKYNRGVMKRITAEVEKETRGTKRLCNLERMGVTVECPDKDTIIEVVYKKYIEDIEPSLKYLQQHFVES